MDEYRERVVAIFGCLFLLAICVFSIPIAALYGMIIGAASPLAWLMSPTVPEAWVGVAFAAVGVCAVLAVAAYLIWCLWQLLMKENIE